MDYHFINIIMWFDKLSNHIITFNKGRGTLECKFKVTEAQLEPL